MTQQPSKHSTDGFFRSRRQVGGSQRPGMDTVRPSAARPLSVNNQEGGLRLERRQATPLGANVNDYFHAPAAGGGTIAGKRPFEPTPLNGKRGGVGDNPPKKPGFAFRKPSRTTMKRIAIALAILLVVIGGYFLIKFFIASSQIFKGNAFSAIFAQGKELKMDENGRSNVLLFGTSEDDPGHEGAQLSDSIMIASIDQNKKDVFLVSVPRDLYVDYGMACNSGYEGKINELYVCGKANGGGSEDAGQEALREKVGELFGLEMHYSVHVNYTAMRDIVDAVGGITVDIDSDDPRGILDRNFDWRCNYQCYYVKHPNGPVELNGKEALALARARGSVAPTYGLSGGNFDREQYQQKILIAIKEKAVSAGTIANPIKINALIDALGDNVRTTFEAAEMKTLADLAQEIDVNNIKRLSLVDEENPLVTAGSIGGSSIVQPTAGSGDFSEIQAAVDAYATGDTSYLEGATVDVLNASGIAGAATEQAEELEAEGVTVEVVGNAPEDADAGPVRLYDVSGGEAPATLKKLEMLLGVQAIKELPSGVTSDSDFVIIVGSNGVS